MSDMLVKLYELSPLQPTLDTQQQNGTEIRRPLAAEKHVVLDWVERHFNLEWRSECEVAFARQPVCCYIALRDKTILGFACHDTSSRNFFGPTGVDEAHRGQGIGNALLLCCLHSMREQGYAYAIIGGVGPDKFYEKAVGAQLIEGSDPGIYRDMISDS